MASDITYSTGVGQGISVRPSVVRMDNDGGGPDGQGAFLYREEYFIKSYSSKTFRDITTLSGFINFDFDGTPNRIVVRAPRGDSNNAVLKLTFNDNINAVYTHFYDVVDFSWISLNPLISQYLQKIECGTDSELPITIRVEAIEASFIQPSPV